MARAEDGNYAMNSDGMVVLESAYGPSETANRLVAAIGEHGMAVMARVDHAAAAAKVGLDLRPTEVLMFGNPRGGTPLMQVAQTAGIDLPLKALVWQDAAGKTWLSYNDPAWLAKRHALPAAVDATVKALSAMLKAVTTAATAPQQ